MVQTQNKNLIPDIEYDSLRSWIRLILLFIVGVVGTVGMWSVVVVMPALETEFAIDRGKASLLYATTMVGFGLGNFLIGKVIDKFGLKFPIIVAVILLSSSYLVAMISNQFWHYWFYKFLWVQLHQLFLVPLWRILEIFLKNIED